MNGSHSHYLKPGQFLSTHTLRSTDIGKGKRNLQKHTIQTDLQLETLNQPPNPAKRLGRPAHTDDNSFKQAARLSSFITSLGIIILGARFPSILISSPVHAEIPRG